MFRRALLLAASLLLFPLASRAQPLPDRAPIKGIVVDEAGRPVPSAVLIIRRQDDTVATAFWGAEARTDAAGRFLISEAEEGRYFVNVESPGFAPLVSFPLDWSVKSAPIRLPLLHLSRLSLRVVSLEGTPLVEAPVWVRLRDENGETVTRAVTDAKGEVVVPNVAPSSYSLVLVAQSGIFVSNGVTIKGTSPSPVEARLTEGATLRIKATDPAGAALGGASLVLFPQSPEEAVRLGGPSADPGQNWALLAAANAPQALVSRDGDGVLELKHLPPGRFSARLSLPGYGTKPRELILENGKVSEWNADFPARRSASLSLMVRDGRGEAVANTTIALRFLGLASNGTIDEGAMEAPPVLLPNTPPDMSFVSSGPNARVVRTDAAGKVVLFPVRAGRFRVFASRPTSDGWLRAPVAPEGAPADIVVSPEGSNVGEVQVP